MEHQTAGALPARGLEFLVDAMEKVVAEDVGSRGINGLFEAARGGLQRAARTLRAARRVLIVTGFYVPFGVPETDGPPGAAALAAGLCALGIGVDVATDPVCAPVVAPMVEYLQRTGHTGVQLIVFPGPAPPSYELPAELRDAVRLFEAQLCEPDAMRRYVDDFLGGGSRYSHVVSIERPGAAADGSYYSMSGTNLSDRVGPLDAVFRRARALGAFTVGIGDGGNEIGMGNVADTVADSVPQGRTIACVTECDALVCCGVSNWGGYALAAAIGALERRSACLWQWQDDCELMHALVGAGAVDGRTGQSTTETVDGVSCEELHRPVLLALNALAEVSAALPARTGKEAVVV